MWFIDRRGCCYDNLSNIYRLNMTGIEIKQRIYKAIMHSASQFAIALVIFLVPCGCGTENSKIPEIPVIEGAWWSIAGNPDLGSYNNKDQQNVDFTVFKASDGTWQLWGCMRYVSNLDSLGKRLLYRWESAVITDTSWIPRGIALVPDTAIGERMVQSPFCYNEKGLYNLFYSDYNTPQICLMTGTDGKNFTRVLNKKGKVGLWEMSQEDQYHGRDPMIIKIGDLYYCYYCAHTDFKGAVYCRTSKTMAPGSWSRSTKVAWAGSAGNTFTSAESPFVFYHKGWYYLFRTPDQKKCFVYASRNPMEFCYDNDKFLVATLDLAQPEIVEDNGHLYIASFKPGLHGYRMARLGWERGKTVINNR